MTWQKNSQKQGADINSQKQQGLYRTLVVLDGTW